MSGEKNVKPVHMGVIGTGMISGTYLDTLTSRFDIIQVDAIAARNRKKAEQAAEKYGIRGCTIDELLSDPEIELVLNLTPPTAHEDIITRALEAGKHVYTEKCFAMDVQTAQRLCRLAQEKNLYLGTAPDTFLSGWMQTARQVIDSGRLGTITSFAMHGNRDNERMLGAMDYMNRPGGGLILDYSVYYLTALINLLGPVRRLSATVKAPYPTHVNQFELSPHFGQVIDTPNESQFYSLLELENGITGTMSINSDSVFFDQTYFAIYGNKGILYLSCPDHFSGQVQLYENTYDFAQAEQPLRLNLDIPFPFQQESRGVGVADMAWAIRENREHRACAQRACHVLDVQECMVKSDGENSAFVEVRSTCKRAEPLRTPFGTEESSLLTK
jgi:predicted dehydrogenase